MRSYHLHLGWEPLPESLPGVQARLEQVLESWRGTRYGSGQRLRGVAADCIGGCFGVVDDMDGRQRASNPLLPTDAALHSPKECYKAVAALRRIYAPAERLRERALQPGDLLVVGPGGGGPGHLMMVGPRKNTLWHSARAGGQFTQAGWALGDGFDRVFAVYRLGDRERWVR